MIRSHNWPGNIRELHNVIERAVILNQGDELILPLWEGKTDGTDEEASVLRQKRPLRSLEELEKEAIEEVLRETNGHRRKSAEILGISLRTLQYKLKQFNIEA